MSRVGKYPVSIPDGVEVSLVDDIFTAKGKNGELTVRKMESVDLSIEDKQVVVTPKKTNKKARQAWGATRALINNAVVGVSEGFVKRLEVKGVGYRAQVQGNVLKLSLGYSHDIDFPIPEDLKIAIEGERNQTLVAIYGADKQRVGQVASNIRSQRPPEPYKGKGVKYVDETILRKEGKKK